MKKIKILAITLLVVLVMLVGMGAVACGGAADETTPPPGDGQETTTPPPGDGQETTPPPGEVEMEITSTAFRDGETIPNQHTCSGQDISPALSWSGVPAGTQSFVLIVDDHDAPGGTFTHWIIFNIPADTLELEEAIPPTAELSSGARQGTNDFGSIGYRGPCPPSGSGHHYYFVVYALDTTLDLAGGPGRTQVETAMQGHILDQAELVGLFQR
jgi:Raf kinase inhibitor-like YbhB/YbcL family protein